MYDYISSQENLQKSNELVIPQDQLFRRDRNSMEMMWFNSEAAIGGVL